MSRCTAVRANEACGAGYGWRANERRGIVNSAAGQFDIYLAAITGQKPQVRPARQSISGFKIRTGMIVGLRVTLRGKRMRDFLNRVVNITLPRVRDFRGIPKKNIDRGGVLTIGIRDHVSFPEIKPQNSKASFGIEFTLVPSTAIPDKEEAIRFYQSLGILFER